MAKQSFNAKTVGTEVSAESNVAGFGFWKPVFLLMTAVSVIATYYAGTNHAETAGAGFGGYVLAVLIIYGGWKAWTSLSGEKEVAYSPAFAIGATIGQIALLCAFFPFPASGYAGAGFTLFFKILGYLALPTAIVAGTSGFGFWALKRFFPDFSARSREFRIVGGLSLGIAAYLFLLSVTTSAFGYSLITTFVPLVVLSAIGWKETWESFLALGKKSFRYENHNAEAGVAKLVALPLISTEVLFLVLTFLIGVNFINVVRPMPIGWDDLGVYMNYPKIMAETGTIERLGTIAWQTLTGIGFLFRSAPQAFFLNQIGGILSVVVIGLSMSRFFSFENSKKSYLNLPLLFAVAAYAMPMIVFQQAKDMKLDPGLLSITTASIFFLYEALRNKEELKENLWKILALAGFLAGIAFAVKFTTLMVFLAASAVICYAGFGLVGFYGFFALFVGLFTKLGLWAMLNVNYPKDDPALLSTVSIVSFGISALCFAYAIHKNRAKAVSHVLVPLLAFAVAAGVAFAPWIGKNAHEISAYGGTFNIGNLLNGIPYPVPADVLSIRTPEENAAIAKANSDAAMSSKGTTTNEDFGRYFGYEDGINNHLKLPFNLTYQKNQPGEYTEISFIFLALLPAVFVFLAFRHPVLAFAPVAVVIFEYLYFWNPPASVALTALFSKFLLPGGYFVIAAIVLLPLAYFHFALNRKEERNERFLLNMAFLGFYGFVFVIAAYGIVWYGIAIYVLMFAAMGLSLEKAVSEEESSDDSTGFITAILVFGIVGTYLFQSAAPHGWSNFRNAGFEDFKAWKLTQDEAIFSAHPDYLSSLATLNLKDPEAMTAELVSQITDAPTKSILIENIGAKPDVEKLQQILDQMVEADAAGNPNVPEEKLKAMNEAASETRRKLYERILYPAAAERNQGTIYRIGTFLTYFISENRKRYLEDSLVQSFGQYIYDEKADVTVARLKKLGVKYFLIDLNAATIDRDPRHDLTKRFENLLRTFRSDKLKLVKTDSLCLKAAIDTAGVQTDEEYLILAGVNSESYSSTGAVTYRTQKQNACHQYFAELIKRGEVSATQNSFLLPISRYIQQAKPQTDDAITKIIAASANHGWVALFEVK